MPAKMNGRAILIAGPTASGKSAAALFLAERLGGVVVNADSMQVYRDLRILTARPSPDEEAQVPHVLYGHVDAAVRHSAGRWLEEARVEAARIMAEGRVPIFTGGTGLYFRVLEEGIAEVPEVPEALRREIAALEVSDLRARAQALGLDAELDRQRLVRALTVRLATGRRLEEFHGSGGLPGLPSGTEVLRLFIAPDREKLVRRIARRFGEMLEQGAVEEVERLLARRLDPSLPVMKAHGVRNIAAALRGEISMEEAAQGAITETRQYAKRQMTWARRFMRAWTWAEDAASAAETGLALARERDWC